MPQWTTYKLRQPDKNFNPTLGLMSRILKGVLYIQGWKGQSLGGSDGILLKKF